MTYPIENRLREPLLARAFSWLWLAALAAASAACGNSDSPGARKPVPDRRPGPSLVLLTLDTTRADHLSCYGSDRVRTPHLDRLAADGVLFESAYTHAPLTLPAHASLFTGVLPSRHGVLDNGAVALNDGWTTLAERFDAAGFDTAAFVSSVVLARKYGLAAGFETYDDALERRFAGGEGPERTAAEVVDAALEWLSFRRDAPFFLWLHFYDPHTPYVPPAPFDNEYADRPYAGEIASMDAQIGRLLEAIAERETGGDQSGDGAQGGVHIIAVGDHGESLGDHGEATHGILLNESVVRVPLIVRGPGIASGRRVSSIVRLIDIMPTVADLFSLERSADADDHDADDHDADDHDAQASGALQRDLLVRGTSLRGWLDGSETGPANLSCVMESYHPYFQYGWAPIAAVHDREWRFVASSEDALYRTPIPGASSAAPAGGTPAGGTGAYERNVIAGNGDTAARMRLLLLMSMRPFDQDRAPVSVTLSTAERQRLTALGYAVDTPSASASLRPPILDGWSDLPDPAARVPVVGHFLEAAEHMRHARLDSAIELYRKILSIDDRSARAYNAMGVVRNRQGNLAAAAENFQRAVATDPGYASAHANLGATLDARGQRSQAERSYREALRLDPSQVGAAYNLGLLYYETSRFDDALGMFGHTDAIRADRPDNLLMMARCHVMRGRDDDAEPLFRRVLELVPDMQVAHFELGCLLTRTGNLDESADHLERAATMGDVEPRSWIALAQAALDAERHDLLRRIAERVPPKPEDR